MNAEGSHPLIDDWLTAIDRRLDAYGGEKAAARLIAGMPAQTAADARGLAYRLFQIATDKGWAAEALVYNELAASQRSGREAGRCCAKGFSTAGPVIGPFLPCC